MLDIKTRVLESGDMKNKKDSNYAERDALGDFTMIYLLLLVALISFMVPFFSDFRTPITKIGYAQYLIPVAVLTDFPIRFGLKNNKKDGGMKDTSKSNFKHPALFYLHIVSACVLVGYMAMGFSSALLIND